MENIFNLIALYLNYISILIVLFGVFICILNKNKNNWECIYLVVILLFEVCSFFPDLLVNRDITLFINFSFLVHFVFLTHFYIHKRVFKKSIIIVGFLLLLSICLNIVPSYFKLYLRFIYSLAITFYSLMYMYGVLKERIKVNKKENILNNSILLFFCVDAFLAIATDYLINNSLIIVSWFWTFRAVLLQVFYVSLIYYLWKGVKRYQ